MCFMISDVKRSKFDVFNECFWVFMLGCTFGTVWEMLNHFMHHGNIVSRSALIYGPFNPVYGIGALLFMALTKIKNPLKLFVSGMVLGGFCEYMCSLIQEKVFGTLSWNYSNNFMNIGGRTSLFYMACWGLLALTFSKFVYPRIINLINHCTFNYSDIITVCVAIFMIFNCVISIGACIRQNERAMGSEATNSIQMFFDKHYPDERLNKIYENSESAKTKQAE